MENNWNGLVEGIVAQAVEDYKEAVQIIGCGEPSKKETKQAAAYRRSIRRKREVESFFRSRWFAKLTGANGKRVLAEIQRQTGIV